MKSRRNYLLGGLLILLLAGGASLFGQGPGQEPPEAPLPDELDDLDLLDDMDALDDLDAFAHQPEMRERLGITDAQVEQLRTLRRTAAKSGIRNRADWAVKRIELEELLEADKPDRTLIDKKLREIADLQYGMLKARVDTRLALAGVLTPEQRSKLRSMMRQRMRGRMQRGRRGPQMQEPGFGPRGSGRRGFGMRDRAQPPPPPPPPPSQ